jgi:small subunit ribosomal protein S6
MIVDPRLTEEEVAQLSTRLQEGFTALGGQVGSVENWGKRRLSFDLLKQREGQYLLFQVQAEPSVVREYERQLRLNESVLRFMTTRVSERRRRADLAQAEAAGASASPAAPAPSEVV